MADPLLSVVVCTHERADALGRCLEALAALEDPVEVVVVDSASQEPCTDLVERFAGRIPRLRLVCEEGPACRGRETAGSARPPPT